MQSYTESQKIIRHYQELFSAGEIKNHRQYAMYFQKKNWWRELGIEYPPGAATIENLLIGQPSKSPLATGSRRTSR